MIFLKIRDICQNYEYEVDTCIMQIMLPQAMVVYEVSWHLTWVLPLQRLMGLLFNTNSFEMCVKVPKATNGQNNNSADESMTGKNKEQPWP